MKLRTRIMLAAAAAVAISVIAASFITYAVVSHNLLAEIDSSLRHQLQAAPRMPRVIPPGSRPPFRPPGTRQALFKDNFLEIVTAKGRIVFPVVVKNHLPVTAVSRRLAAAGGPARFDDITVNGVHIRTLTGRLSLGYAVIIGRPLTSVDSTLAVLRVVLLVVSLAGVALAAGLGAIVAGTALRPISRLASEVDDITGSGDLGVRVAAHSRDEIGRLAANFNNLLASVQDLVLSQQRLVADASHELRTPLTSIRTNIEVLATQVTLGESDQREILSDLTSQVEELSSLVNDLVELDRGSVVPGHREPLRLDLLVQEVVTRTARHFPAIRFETNLHDCTVIGEASRLARAISNLLENAAKWSPPNGTVTITVTNGSVSVRDCGPGIAPEDLPHVFDRFYRSRDARGKPGSGLGLTIVRQVVEAHGGSVSAENAPGRGTVLSITLPQTDELTEGILVLDS